MISTVLPVTLVHTSFFNKLKEKLDGRKIDTEYYKDKIQLGVDFKETNIRSELRLWITKDKYIDIDVYVTDDIGTDILLGVNFLLAEPVKHINDNKIIIRYTEDIMIPLHKTFKKLRQSRQKQQNKIETERVIKYSSLKILTSAVQTSKAINFTNLRLLRKMKHDNDIKKMKNISSNYERNNKISKENKQLRNSNLQLTKEDQNNTSLKAQDLIKMQHIKDPKLGIQLRKEPVKNNNIRHTQYERNDKRYDIRHNWNSSYNENQSNTLTSEDINSKHKSIELKPLTMIKELKHYMKMIDTGNTRNQNITRKSTVSNDDLNKEIFNDYEISITDNNKKYIHEIKNIQKQCTINIPLTDDTETKNESLNESYNSLATSDFSIQKNRTRQAYKDHNENRKQRIKESKPEENNYDFFTNVLLIGELNSHKLNRTREEIKNILTKYPQLRYTKNGYFDMSNLSATHMITKDSKKENTHKITNIKNNTDSPNQILESSFENDNQTFLKKNEMETKTSLMTELTLVDDTPCTNQEFLNLFDLDHLPQETQSKLHRMFLNTREVFATHKWDIGKTNCVEMDIELTSNVPQLQNYIAIPPQYRQQVQEILDQLKKYDIIRECNETSTFCSNIMVIKKKDGKSIRLLFDGRLLNNDTKQVAMASITKPEILSHISGKKHLTSLDFADAFFHIPLAKEAQPYTAFWAGTQRLCFNRCPQGLKNSPSYLKNLLDSIFYDMTDSVLFYADDLLIATDGSQEEHFKILQEVLLRLQKAGLKLRPQKMLIAKDNIEFLGMNFNTKSINIPEEKLKAFKEIISPNTPKKCKSIIACLSFYRNFIPNFANHSREIMELSTIEPKKFKWTQDHEEKLRSLINIVCNNTKLYLPTVDQPFYINTSSTETCASGTLYQIDTNGETRIINAVSRSFTKAERNYPGYKKEILALIYTLKSNDYFVKYAKDLTINMDVRSLMYLRLAKESSGILLRLSIDIAKYDFKTKHINNPYLNPPTEPEQQMAEKDIKGLIKRLVTNERFELNQTEKDLIDTKMKQKRKRITNKNNTIKQEEIFRRRRKFFRRRWTIFWRRRKFFRRRRTIFRRRRKFFRRTDEQSSEEEESSFEEQEEQSFEEQESSFEEQEEQSIEEQEDSFEEQEEKSLEEQEQQSHEQENELSFKQENEESNNKSQSDEEKNEESEENSEDDDENYTTISDEDSIDENEHIRNNNIKSHNIRKNIYTILDDESPG